MRILVTNDDGIHAEGIQVLARKLAQSHEVHVVAPDRERSATGHALTIHKPLRVNSVNLDGNIRSSFEMNGTPSDCVKLALGALLQEPPELVVSGINRGANLGTDVLYSGTVSGAVEGSILGIPSIAFSLVSHDPETYEPAANYALKIVELLSHHRLSTHFLLNVNIPAIEEKDIEGIAVTKLCRRKYRDLFEERKDPRGNSYWWLSGEAIETDEDEDSDVVAIHHNRVSVTPLTFNLTHTRELPRVKEWFSTVGIK